MPNLDLKYLLIEELNEIQNKIIDELYNRYEESNSSDNYVEELSKVYSLEYDLKDELAELESEKEGIEEQIIDVIDELERLENKESDLDYKLTVGEFK